MIVGSGPGGCVLANRLTENSKWNVLLIEAGKVETPVQDIPVLAAYMQSTAYNWGYTTEPQDGLCLGSIKSLLLNSLLRLVHFKVWKVKGALFHVGKDWVERAS